MKKYETERNRMISEMQQLEQQLKAVTEAIRAAETVDEKLAQFDQRDRIMEKQTALQISMVRWDQQYIEELGKTASNPRFQPGRI